MLFVATTHTGHDLSNIIHIGCCVTQAPFQTTCSLSVNHPQHNATHFQTLKLIIWPFCPAKIDNIDTFCSSFRPRAPHNMVIHHWRLNLLWSSKTYHNIRHHCVDKYDLWDNIKCILIHFLRTPSNSILTGVRSCQELLEIKQQF